MNQLFDENNKRYIWPDTFSCSLQFSENPSTYFDFFSNLIKKLTDLTTKTGFFLHPDEIGLKFLHILEHWWENERFYSKHSFSTVLPNFRLSYFFKFPIIFLFFLRIQNKCLKLKKN